MTREIIDYAESRVTIRERDLGVGHRELAFVDKKIHEIGTELHVHHRGKRLKVEYVPDDSNNLLAIEVLE